MFTAKLQKKDGALVYKTDKEKLAFKLFVDSLKEGDSVDLFVNLLSKDGSLAQIAKVHTCIRRLAEESGYTFTEMKLLVKDNSGLKLGDEYKSFKECDKSELSAAIQTCVEIGDLYNVNLG
ncbi:MAG: hypothetical protein ACW98X_27280 [Promethearchaeota archaeon]|jgi:hypothetical protein